MPRAALSQTGICNLALAHLAVAKQIANWDERSNEANACKLWFDQVKDEVLGEFPWPFAGKTAALALVEEAPTFEWGYSYRIPSDCLTVRRLLPYGSDGGLLLSSLGYVALPASSMGAVETPQSRIPYRIMADDEGLLIYCNIPPVAATATTPAQPQVEYTREFDTPNYYPADFSQAIALKLAYYTAPALTGGDPNKLGARAKQLYDDQIADAKVSAANEEQLPLAPESEAIRARA